MKFNTLIYIFIGLFLGSGKLPLIAIASIFSIFLLMFNYKTLVYNSWSLAFVLISLLMLITTFLIGHNNFVLSSPALKLINVILFIPILVLAASLSPDKFKIFLSALIFAISFEAFSQVIASYLTDPVRYGYSLLIDPYTGNEINSVTASNALTITTVFLIQNILDRTNVFRRIICYVGIAFTVITSIFLAQRLFFLVIAIFLAYSLISFSTIKRFMKLIIIFLITISIALPFLQPFVLEDEFLVFWDFLLLRFDLDIIGGSRWNIFMDSITSIPEYPFGGYQLDYLDHHTYWIHNFFLDIWRLSGWIPLILSLISSIIVFLYLYVNRGIFNKHKKIIELMLVIFFIIQFDVVIEGNIMPLFICMAIASFILNTTLSQNHKILVSHSSEEVTS